MSSNPTVFERTPSLLLLLPLSQKFGLKSTAAIVVVVAACAFCKIDTDRELRGIRS